MKACPCSRPGQQSFPVDKTGCSCEGWTTIAMMFCVGVQSWDAAKGSSVFNFSQSHIVTGQVEWKAMSGVQEVGRSVGSRAY